MHLCNRVDRRSKSQNISELAFSLNRYHNSATPLFYSETQSDISFLIIPCKDNANREQNSQACLGVMPRCSLSYAKILRFPEIKQAFRFFQVGQLGFLPFELALVKADKSTLSQLHMFQEGKSTLRVYRPGAASGGVGVSPALPALSRNKASW